MFTYCVKRHTLSRANQETYLCRIALAYPKYAGLCTALARDGDCNHNKTLLKLFTDRYFITQSELHEDTLRRGASICYGPLGLELRKNIMDQWWNSVTRSREKLVYGICTLHSRKEISTGSNQLLKMMNIETLNQILDQNELNKDQLVQRLQGLLQSSLTLRTGLLQGALEQYPPLLELVSKKLPFGLAETGLCFQQTDGTVSTTEVTQSSLVWFCSPRTSSQWLDHWARQRLQWWRKLALGPSDFSCIDIPEEELGRKALRGVKIVYSFPWGQEALETLWSRGDAELLQTHKAVRSKLQCRDGRKLVVPHVVSVTGDMDRGVLAYLYNSLQQVKKANGKQKLLQRKVLKLHPVLAPVKVAVDMGKGATVELRRISESLLQEFLEDGVYAWPGYLETMSTSIEQLNNKYDEMGVIFTVVINENTLESGLLQVRSRDTTIKEIMHISEVKRFLCRYVSAAGNL